MVCAVLALLAALLAFAYATLSLRRLFQGEYIGAWREFGQVETYAYSALWLALGVALLVGGMLLKSQVLRIASGALIVIAVAKVFLFDMSELEGVLRALSFIGLGIVLIGIGLFYQRMLRLGLAPLLRRSRLLRLLRRPLAEAPRTFVRRRLDPSPDYFM